MEKEFHNEDFEKLLKDNANQYRMYPSEKVWKNIYATMHTRRKWYGITALVMLLITATLVTVFISNNDSATEAIAGRKNSQGSAIRQQQLTGKPANSIADIGRPNALMIAEGLKIAAGNNTFSPVFEITRYTAPAFSDVYTENKTPHQFMPAPSLIISSWNAGVKNETSIQKDIDLLNDKITAAVPEDLRNTDAGTIQDVKKESEITRDVMALASNNVPVKTKKKSARLTAQLYFTPTISYRKLSENKSYSSNQPYSFSQLTDVNNVVNHKPAMGFEFGFETRYSVNNRFTLKSGLQFNINRYDIRAYYHPTEIATIALNSGFPRDSVAALSNYRNFSGYSPNWLENFYFQVALPVGAEIILSDNKKVQWGVAGTVQPTYVIGDRAYLISSDYKNYAKVPNLMRRWNLSTGFETFVTYSTGRIKWQVGPQVRYQHLSSFVSKYPVKENLFDVGLKVGAKLNKKK